MVRGSAARAFAPSAAPLFAALGDPTRLRVVQRLAREGSLSIARLTEGTPVTRQAVTKHLGVLARAGLIEGRREGRENVWQLRPRGLDDARRHFEAISAEWDRALTRLSALVEATP